MPTDHQVIYIYRFSVVQGAYECVLLYDSRFSTLRLHLKFSLPTFQLYLLLDSADSHGTVLKSTGRYAAIKFASEYTA